MIRINLLGVAPPPGPKPEAPPTAGVFLGLVAAGAFLVCGGIVGFLWQYWSRSLATWQQNLANEKRRQAELRDVQAKNQQYQRQLNELEQRMKTIEGLQNSRVGPVDMMSRLGEAVNRTSDLYLLSVTPSGNRVAMRGISNTVESIANFLEALKDSGSFEDVQLQQYFQDDQSGRQSFKFNLDCVYKLPPPPAEGQPAAAAGTPTRRAGM